MSTVGGGGQTPKRSSSSQGSSFVTWLRAQTGSNVSGFCFTDVGVSKNRGTPFYTPNRIESPQRGPPKRVPLFSETPMGVWGPSLGGSGRKGCRLLFWPAEMLYELKQSRLLWHRMPMPAFGIDKALQLNDSGYRKLLPPCEHQRPNSQCRFAASSAH